MRANLRVLTHRDFRRLFWGQAASGLGDQVWFIALALYVTRRTGSPTDLGLVLLAQSLPMVALLLIGGVWADRGGRRPIMIGADAVRALAHALVAVLIVSGGAGIAELVVIEAAVGAARAFFQPAYTGLLPATVPEDELQDARALSSLSATLAVVVGPALGTVLVLTVGAAPAFALDAATFVVSAVLLAGVRPRERGAPAPPRASLPAELRAGWREVRSRSWVWATIAALAVFVLSAYTTWSALAPVVARDFYGGVGVFGVLETLAGVGATLGALAGLAWRPRRPLVAALALAALWPLGNIGVALGAPLAALVAVALAAGFGFTLFEVLWETALARHIPPHALSRVSSYDWMGSLALMPLGYALAGPLAAGLGDRLALGAGGGLAILALALALGPRATRELGDGGDGDGGAGTDGAGGVRSPRAAGPLDAAGAGTVGAAQPSSSPMMSR